MVTFSYYRRLIQGGIESTEQRARTLMHEVAHVAGVGNAGMAACHGVVFGCERSCGGFDWTDSWEQYVHCLGGHQRAQPLAVQDGMLYTTEGNRSPNVQGFHNVPSRLDKLLGFGHVP